MTDETLPETDAPVPEDDEPAEPLRDTAYRQWLIIGLFAGLGIVAFIAMKLT